MRIFLIILLGLSLIFASIGIITNRWYENTSNNSHEGLWIFCQGLSSSSINLNNCHKQPFMKSQVLSLSGLLLLSIGFIFSIIYLFGQKKDHLLIYLTILILLGSTLSLMFSYLLYPRTIHLRQLGYSIYFMLISSIIVLISTGLITFLAKSIRSPSTSI